MRCRSRFQTQDWTGGPSTNGTQHRDSTSNYASLHRAAQCVTTACVILRTSLSVCQYSFIPLLARMTTKTIKITTTEAARDGHAVCIIIYNSSCFGPAQDTFRNLFRYEELCPFDRHRDTLLSWLTEPKEIQFPSGEVLLPAGMNPESKTPRLAPTLTSTSDPSSSMKTSGSSV